MFQFGKYPMDILEMLSGHQAHQFKGLGLERQLQHQQQVQLQHQQQLQQQQQQQSEASGGLLSGLGLGSLQGSRGNAFADSSSLFAKMSAPPPPLPQQTQSSTSQSTRKSSKMGSSSGSSSSAAGYPQFLRSFHPAEAALAQEQLHSGMGRFDFTGGSSGGGSGVIGGVVTSAPPPLHPGLSVPQPSPGPSSSSPSPSSSTTTSNNPPSSTSSVAGLVGPQSDARSLHQQFSCMLAANQYLFSGVPTNASLEQFLVQQGPHNHLGLAESNTGLAPPPALHPSHTHGHPTTQPQQQQPQLPPHALSHAHTHAHPHHPLHPAPQPSSLGGFDFQGIPVLSTNQLASLMQQEAGLPLPLPLHLSVAKDDVKGDSGSGAVGSGGSGSRRKKAMAGYLPQRKSDGNSSNSSANCHGSGTHVHDGSSGLVGGGVGMRVLSGDPSILSSTTQTSSSSTVSSSSSSAPTSNSASVLVSNISQTLKSENQQSMITQAEQEPMFHCRECGKSFNHLPTLRRHLRCHEQDGSRPNSSTSHHQSDLPHSTQDVISQNAHHQQDNQDPMSSTCSSPDKSYCCNECGKGFKKRGHLQQHGLIHSGDRPYSCTVCERSFNRRESLTRHEKIHEEKPYRCPACGRCFRESSSLLNHAASGSCGKPERRSRSSDGSSVGSVDGKVESDFPGGQLSDSKDLVFCKTEDTTVGLSCDSLYSQGRSINQNPVCKTEEKYNPEYSRDPYQTSYRIDDYRRHQGNQSSYSGDSCSNSLTGPALRKAPLAPTLHPHPQNQQQQHHHQQQGHLPLSSLLDDSEDEVTSSAMSAIAAAAAASVLPVEMNSNGGREERRDIIGGLLGGLGFGPMGTATTAGNGGNGECLSGSMIPLSHPSQQPNSQNANNPNAKPKRPRKPRQKREPRPPGAPGEAAKRRRSSQSGTPGDGTDKPYLCTVCGRGFSRRETLRRHERVHTGEKPFHCDICGKDFREPFHLTKHQTVHSGEKNYKCTLCGKDFGYAQSLKRHEKLHLRADFKPRRSKTKSAANQGGDGSQQPNQTNPDPYYPYPQDKGSNASTSNQPPPKLYTCEICWKSFRHHFHLTAHHQAIHEHGGEKLFSCEVCGKAFSYSNSLSRHRLSQHGLTRTGPTVQQRVNESIATGPSASENEAATNALLHLTPENGSHGVQQPHSTIAHTPHTQPGGYSPLFYSPESGHHNSVTSHPQHLHYSNSTMGPLQVQQPISGKQLIYSAVQGNSLHSTPPHIHISPTQHSQQQQQQHHHPFLMQSSHLQQMPQTHVEVSQRKKKKKFKMAAGVPLRSGFGACKIPRRQMYLKRKRYRRQQQLKRLTWMDQMKFAKFTGEGLGLNLVGGTWCVGRLRFKGLRSLIVPSKTFTCPVCPFTAFSSQISLSVHRATRHPPTKHGHYNRLCCVVCGKRSRRLLSALRHRFKHFSQRSFPCSRCPYQFWNGTLLQRHEVACQRVSRRIRLSNIDKAYRIERSTIMSGHRH